MKLIDGKYIAEIILDQVEQKVKKMKRRGIHPRLSVVLVGNDKPSETYVRKKGEMAKRVGIEFELHRFPASIKKATLIAEIKSIQKKKKPTGMIIQLPLPERLYESDVLNAVDPSIDVDCLTDTNIGKLVMETQKIIPPTPGAVASILHHLQVDLAGKNVAIVGMGALVGKPLAIMMANTRASVTTCNSATKDIKEKCQNADILITGVGKKDLIRGNMVKKGAIVIDTGIAFDDGVMYGDVNFEEVKAKAKYLTPTPGGVGPITVARLLLNVVTCAESLQNKV